MDQFKYYFFLRKSQKSKAGKYPLYLRIRKDGLTKEKSLKLRLSPSEWNQDAQSSTLQHVNLLLYRIINNLEEAKYKHNTPAELMNDVLGVKPSKSFVQIFEEHNEQIANSADYAKETAKKYGYVLNTFKKFLRKEYSEDILCRQLKPKMFEKYWDWLRNEKGYKHNSAVKNCQFIHKICRRVVKEGFLKKDPMRNFNKTEKKTFPTYLNQKELQRIENKRFDFERIEKVRKIFLLACYTGLSYGDITSLTKDDIEEDFILKYRQKTGELSRIYLTDKAKQLISDFEAESEDDKIIPPLSNQKYNVYLKEIADSCAIRKRLTTHSARHTFATQALENGVPIEVVSKQLGHSTISQTSHYARVTMSKIKRDMKKAGY